MQDLDDALLAASPLPSHDDGGDKEDRGRVLIIGGSAEAPGGALLAGIGALRAGAGKLQIATDPAVATAMAIAVPEAKVFAYEPDRVIEALQRCRGAALGPGMIGEAFAADLTQRAMQQCDTPLVIDAAALSGLQRANGPVVLTPHAGEAASLLDVEKAEIEADPARFAREAATHFNAVVAMKGATTFIAAPDGRMICHRDGVFGLATSGSGDVLAGLIAGLLARGAEPFTACAWGVALHARSGARLTRRLGPLGFLAREILDEVPIVLAQLSPTGS